MSLNFIYDVYEEYNVYGVHDDPCPTCPICSEECEWIYKDANNEIVGCDNCVSKIDAYEIYEL